MTGRVSVASAGGEVNPDEFSDSMIGVLSTTIKMLAYEHGWFAKDGIIDIPPAELTEGIHTPFVRANHYLCEAWGQVELSEGRCRYFGGSVTEVDGPAREGGGEPAKIIRFEFPYDCVLSMHVAGERVKHMFLGFGLGLENEPGIRASSRSPNLLHWRPTDL